MRILIISQPVLDESNNMGKTLMGYFRDFSSKDVFQLYLRQGTPTNTDVCENFYCFSDSDALKSIFDDATGINVREAISAHLHGVDAIGAGAAAMF